MGKSDTLPACSHRRWQGAPGTPRCGMELCVLHYHFRPGGVRRVIEMGLPALARAAGIARVVLAAGEAPPADWRELMERALHPCAVEWCVEPAFGYWSAEEGRKARALPSTRRAKHAYA